MRFKDFIKEATTINLDRAMQVFDYKNGDFIDAKDLRNRLGKLSKMHHPDRGGDHTMMVDVNNAYELLQQYVGQNLPSQNYAHSTNNGSWNTWQGQAHTPEERPWGSWQGSNKSNYQEPQEEAPEAAVLFKHKIHRGLDKASDYASEAINMRGEEQEQALYQLYTILNNLLRECNDWVLDNPAITKYVKITPNDFEAAMDILNAVSGSPRKYRKAIEQARSKIWNIIHDLK